MKLKTIAVVASGLDRGLFFVFRKSLYIFKVLMYPIKQQIRIFY